MLSIEKTKEYDKFKYIKGNREIESGHVLKIKRSLEKCNLMHLNPVLVDSEFFVIDGQHRIEACKRLEIPIHYRVVDNSDLKNLGRLNVNRSNWKLLNYLNFYVVSFKNGNYIKLKDFMTKNALSLTKAFIFIKYNHRKMSLKNAFIEGDFLFDLDEELLEERISKYRKFIDFCDSKDLDSISAFMTESFISAFLDFTESKKITWNRFWERTIEHPTLLMRCYNRLQFLEMLLKLYNKGSSYKLDIADL